MGPELVRYQDVTYAVQSGGKQAPARSLLGSFCVFTVNGESAGVAFVDLLEASLAKHAVHTAKHITHATANIRRTACAVCRD